tara:strand:- start:225 stop:1163 length:939 start_codon:yes stop_codon:yes gene_type:complete
MLKKVSIKNVGLFKSNEYRLNKRTNLLGGNNDVSGKSTFIRTMFMLNLFSDQNKEYLNDSLIRGYKNKDENSFITVDYEINNRKYIYEIEYNKECILSEKVSEITDLETKTLLLRKGSSIDFIDSEDYTFNMFKLSDNFSIVRMTDYYTVNEVPYFLKDCIEFFYKGLFFSDKDDILLGFKLKNKDKFNLDLYEKAAFYDSYDEAKTLFEKLMQIEDHKMIKIEINDTFRAEDLKPVKASRFFREDCDFVPYLYLSSGVKALYQITIELFLACSKKEKGVLFIDDLTKKVSEECLGAIIEYCRENNTQLIYS